MLNKQLYNKLLSHGRSLIKQSFENINFQDSKDNTTGIESWYFTHPINNDFADQILFLNHFVFTCTSTVCNWDITKIDGLVIHFYIDKNDYNKLNEFCDKMDYQLDKLTYGYNQLKMIDNKYIELSDDLILVSVYDTKVERKTLYLELCLYFNELNNNLYNTDEKWLKRDFFDKILEKLNNNEYIKKSLEYLDKIKQLGLDILEHRIYSTNDMIIFNYNENKIDDLREKLEDKYKLDKWRNKEYYIIRNDKNKTEEEWHIFYEDLYNIFQLCK